MKVVLAALIRKGASLSRGGIQKIRLPALAGMAILAVAALADVIARDSIRVVMTFYAHEDEKTVIEERIIKNARLRVDTVTAYVNETLLGPLSYGTEGLFPAGRTQSCVVSGDTAYIGLPPDAVWAGAGNAESGKIIDGAQALEMFKRDVKRNFWRVKHVEVFIDGAQTGQSGVSGEKNTKIRV
jgi:hypothetical protein